VTAEQQPERVGWWHAILAVLAGSLVAGIGCLLVLVVLDFVHLVPYGFGDPPGSARPWRIDSPWALAADLGPLLAVSFAFAGVTNWYLTQRNGVHARRWPLALVAAAVGWLPLAGDQRGFVGASGGAAFCVVVIAARAWSATARKPMRWSRPIVAALAAATVAFGAVSVTYGMLHPLAAKNGTSPASATLRHGRSQQLDFILENRGPADARVLGVTLAGSRGLRLLRVQLGGARGTPTRDLRFKTRTIEPGAKLPLFAQLGSRACEGPGGQRLAALRALDVRLEVAGSQRTQHVVLDEPLRVRCGSNARR
jgi:hypothetical protein